ncbi:hypothetical protein MPRF_00970 [Mycolicibacterium parafortuitum]|uniref:HTH tetR-type domain-containing protein n=1 Tax=Mycolicibacterium parafortuitum TaxID=39692 RepID=A0A7I7TVL0_MYCPF|nr:TetR/AcrR family transcriptional regulator [Mycolicibacterium parafortuitum]BBY73198.1 hypothetical protein MPRF_00970 [Mycolicibacterium parafortuitum]
MVAHSHHLYGRRSDGTLAAFCSATRELLVARSFRDITVAEIISCTPYARSSFYHYFDSKDDVLVSLAASVLAGMRRDPGEWALRLCADDMGTRSESWSEVFALWSRHDAILGAVIEEVHRSPAIAALWQKAVGKVVATVAVQVRSRCAADEVKSASAETIAAIVVCGIERILYVSSRGVEPRFPDVRATAEALDWLMSALLGRTTPLQASRWTASVSNDSADSFEIETQNSSFVTATSATAILEAMRILLLDCSVDKLSVARITRHAKVSRSTFYFYFESKEAAFVALYRDVADTAAMALHRLHAIDRSDATQLADALVRWLRIDEHSMAVMRSVLHEWPRAPELRLIYQTGMAAQVASLEALIVKDRAAGLAPAGPPAGELAAVLLWTMERAVAGALAAQPDMTDLETVVSCLVELFAAVVYGRS